MQRNVMHFQKGKKNSMATILSKSVAFLVIRFHHPPSNKVIVMHFP